MNTKDALALLNQKFVYKADKGESWKIIKEVSDPIIKSIYGDCEDYSLTLLWLISDKSLKKFWWNIISMKYVLWFCKYDKEFHVVLKHNGECVDNIQKKWTAELPEEYTMLYPMVFPIVALKFLVTKVFRGE